MRTGAAQVNQEIFEKPHERVVKGQYFSEGVKDFSDFPGDIDKLFVSDGSWSISWKKYSDDVGVLRKVTRSRASLRRQS